MTRTLTINHTLLDEHNLLANLGATPLDTDPGQFVKEFLLKIADTNISKEDEETISLGASILFDPDQIPDAMMAWLAWQGLNSLLKKVSELKDPFSAFVNKRLTKTS